MTESRGFRRRYVRPLQLHSARRIAGTTRYVLFAHLCACGWLMPALKKRRVYSLVIDPDDVAARIAFHCSQAHFLARFRIEVSVRTTERAEAASLLVNDRQHGPPIKSCTAAENIVHLTRLSLMPISNFLRAHARMKRLEARAPSS